MWAGRAWIADHAIIIDLWLSFSWVPKTLSMKSVVPKFGWIFFPSALSTAQILPTKVREGGAKEPLAVAVDANGLIAMVGTQKQVLYLNPTIIFFIFNWMTIGWLSGYRWFRCFVNVSIVFCKIKRLTDRIVSNTLTFTIMANPRCGNGSKIPTSPKCSTPRAVPWHQVTRLGLTVDNHLQLPKKTWHSLRNDSLDVIARCVTCV